MDATAYDVIIPIGPGSEREVLALECVLRCLGACEVLPDRAVIALNGSVSERFARAVEGVVGRFPFAEFLRLERGNRGAARNAAVRRGKAPVLVFCDSDTLVSAEAVTAAVDCARRGAFGCCAWRRYLPTCLTPDELVRAAVDASWRAEVANHYVSSGRGNQDPVERHGRSMTFISAFGSCSRALFEQVGGYPELEGYGMEDAALMARLLRHAPFESLAPHEVWHIDHPITPYRRMELRRNIAAAGRQSSGPVFRYWSLFTRERADARCPELLVPRTEPTPWPTAAAGWLPPETVDALGEFIDRALRSDDTAALLVHDDPHGQQLEWSWVTHTLKYTEELAWFDGVPLTLRRGGLEAIAYSNDPDPPEIGWAYQRGRLTRSTQVLGDCDVKALVRLDARDTLERWRFHILLDRLGTLARDRWRGPMERGAQMPCVLDLLTWATGELPRGPQPPFFSEPDVDRIASACHEALPSGTDEILELLREPLLAAMDALPFEGKVYTAASGHGYRVLRSWGIERSVRWALE